MIRCTEIPPSALYVLRTCDFLRRRMEQMNPSILDAGAHTSDNRFYPFLLLTAGIPHPTPSPADAGFTLSYTAPCHSHAHASDRHHIGLNAKASAATPRHRSQPRKHRGLGRAPPNPPAPKIKITKPCTGPIGGFVPDSVSGFLPSPRGL